LHQTARVGRERAREREIARAQERGADRKRDCESAREKETRRARKRERKKVLAPEGGSAEAPLIFALEPLSIRVWGLQSWGLQFGNQGLRVRVEV